MAARFDFVIASVHGQFRLDRSAQTARLIKAVSHPLTTKGKHTVIARATNKIGQTQTTELNHNPPGYHHNVVHSITLNVA